MSANKTLKLLNSITSTTSASHRRRRSSVAVTAAASTFAPMFQSTVPPNFFPHCNQQQQPNQSQPTNQQQHGHHHHHHVHHHGHHHPHGGVNASANVTGYQQFLPVFVTPTTPASSDLHTSYHGTNVTSPPPYYFHTPPISSNGGAGGAAIVGNGKNLNLNLNQQQQQQQAQQQQQPQGQIQQQQLFHPGTQAGAHGVNHSLHHTRTNSLHQDLLNKKHASRPSISQFSVANSSHFQFAFEAQPPSTHESVHHSPVQTSTNSNINNTTAVAPRTTSSKRSAHSRQSSLNQIQTVAQPQQQQRQQQPVVDNSGFSFLCLNPEPVQTTTAPQPVVQNQLPTPTQGFLPGGFFSLTPEDSYPPLCTTFAQPATTPRENNVNSYFSIMPVNPVVQQIAPRNGYPTGYRRPTYQRLTKHAISAVDSKDSREFRWNRVLRYVHDISAPHGAKFPPSEAWILQQRQRVLLTPRHGSKGDAHSLWDGGSLGTNGVDDFIWDDDIQNGKRFTIPPKSQQGEDAPCEEDNMVFTLEPSKADFDLAFGYEVDDTNFCPPAKRTKSNESQKAARRGLHEYLAALKSFELSHVQDMKREAPLTMA